MKLIIFLLALIPIIKACDKNPGMDPVIPLVDKDGNLVDTVRIGTQFWIQQNLNWIGDLEYISASPGRHHHEKYFGISVRCLKD